MCWGERFASGSKEEQNCSLHTDCTHAGQQEKSLQGSKPVLGVLVGIDEEAIHLVKRGCNLEGMRYRVGHALWHPKAGGSVGEICGRLGKKRPQCSVTSAIACRLQSSRQPYISCSLASGTHSVACQPSLGHSTHRPSLYFARYIHCTI